MPTAISEASVFQIAQRRSGSFRGRAILIVALFPLLAATWGLYKVMPPDDLRAQFDGRRPFVYWHSASQLKVVDGSDPFQADVEPIFRMNVDTGEITEATKGDLFRHEGVNSRGERVLLSYPQSINQSLKNASNGIFSAPVYAHFKNMETGETRRLEFDWDYGNDRVINNRFVVKRDRSNIYAIDLEESNPQEFSVSAPLTSTGPDFQVNAIYGTDYLYEIHLPTQTNSNVHKLELFKLGEHQIQLVKSIQMGCSGITRFEGQMLTLSLDGKRVECYSMEDLQFVKTIDISEQFLANYDVVEMHGNLLLGMNKQTSSYDYYDILSGEQLKLPFSGMQPRWWPKDLRYWCFRGGMGNSEKHAYIYDLKEHRVCLAVPYECSSIAFLDDGRFAVVHPAYGVCTVVYDLKTGKSIRHAPYQWCAVALAATLLAWFGWWTTWTVLSAREGTWTWVDLTIIFAIVPSVLTYLGVGNLNPPLGIWGGISPNFAILLGVLIGLLCSSGAIFVFSCSRQSVAVLPLTLVYAALNFWLSSIAVRPRVSIAIHLRVCIVVTGCTALLIAAVFLMRRIGFRFKKSVAKPSVVHDKPSRLRLLDLFIFMGCVGVVVAASKPLIVPMPKLSLQFLVDRYWLPTALASSAISFAVVLTVLNQRAWLARCGVALAGTAWCILVVQQVLMFAGILQRIILPTALQTILVASMSAFICALALRLRSYRISRSIRENPTRI